MSAITIARGDGIGPEIMQVTLDVITAAGAELTLSEVEMGESVYQRGEPTGISEAAWEHLAQSQVLLKGPMSTPQGGGFTSVSLQLRKQLGLYASVRPCVSYSPYVHTRYASMDVVIIRENEEDIYGGIEYRQTTDVVQSLKWVSRPACEKIIRYAFEYARRHGRRKVSAFTKDRIMEFTDGFFKQIFMEIAQDYPELEYEHQSLDIGTARLTSHPDKFDVIVIPNLYGDILSDLVAQITTGSVGLTGSANVGDRCVMFEAIHGSAPNIAGEDIANPSGLILAAVMMLVHLQQIEVAEKVQNAWLTTLEEGLHTADIFREGLSFQKLGTRAFGQAVIERLGRKPRHLPSVHFSKRNTPTAFAYHRPEIERELVGVDVFLDWTKGTPADLANALPALKPLQNQAQWQLEMISNLGVVVWPSSFPETRYCDHWHCRYTATDPQHIDIVHLLSALKNAGFDFIKTENLYRINGKLAYSA